MVRNAAFRRGELEEVGLISTVEEMTKWSRFGIETNSLIKILVILSVALIITKSRILPLR